MSPTKISFSPGTIREVHNCISRFAPRRRKSTKKIFCYPQPPPWQPPKLPPPMAGPPTAATLLPPPAAAPTPYRGPTPLLHLPPAPLPTATPLLPHGPPWLPPHPSWRWRWRRWWQWPKRVNCGITMLSMLPPKFALSKMIPPSFLSHITQTT